MMPNPHVAADQASPALPELAVRAGDLPRIRARALVGPADTGPSSRIVEIVRAQAVKAPARPALVDAETTITYRELAHRVERLRTELARAGCTEGSVVACQGPRSATTAVLLLALESLGAVHLPVDPAWPSARITEVIQRSASTHIVIYPRGSESPTITPTGVERSWARTGDAAPAYLIFTSGTTGLPKGVIVEHRGMVNHLRAKISLLGLSADDRVAFTAPLAFGISIWQALAPLMVGASVVVAGDEDVTFPRRLLRLLQRRAVTVLELVPTAIGTLLDQLERETASLPSLRRLVSTGEELRPGLASRALRELPGATLVNAYGQTECSDDVAHHVVTAQDTALPRLPVGSPVGGCSLHVLVREADGNWRAAEADEAGEVFVAGLPVGSGYLDGTAAARRAFYADPLSADSSTGRLYRTGDLGRIQDGCLRYLGRADRQVKVAGVRLELDEVEAVLSRHPALTHCGVVLSTARLGRAELVAHYVPDPAVGADPHEEFAGQLERFVARTLPAAAVPRRWLRQKTIPLTPNGKVDHRALLRATDPPDGWSEEGGQL